VVTARVYRDICYVDTFGLDYRDAVNRINAWYTYWINNVQLYCTYGQLNKIHEMSDRESPGPAHQNTRSVRIWSGKTRPT